MFQVLKENPRAFLIALLMHLAIIAFMIVGVDWLEKPKQPKSNVEVVQARVVDQSRILAEMERLKQAESKKKADREAVRRKEEQRLADLKRRQQTERKRLDELEQQRESEEKKSRQAAEAKRKEESRRKAKAEQKKRKEAEAKRKAEARKKAEQKKHKEAEAKRKAEAEKKRKEAEVKRKAEAEKKRKQEAARKAREAQLQAAMEAEETASEASRIVAAINRRVSENWLYIPGAVERGLKCTVRVRLGATGTVLLVQTVKSSGDAAFDRSVETAVRKADPLPMPRSERLRNHPDFREHVFEFDPSKSK